MKKLILFFGLALCLLQTACGPAAESRETMHKRAKEVQDSIAKSIKDAIAEVEATPNAIVVKDTAQIKPK